MVLEIKPAFEMKGSVICVELSKKFFQIRCTGFYAPSTFVALTSPTTIDTFLKFASFYLGPHLKGIWSHTIS
jgi:hypothetical protein